MAEDPESGDVSCYEKAQQREVCVEQQSHLFHKRSAHIMHYCFIGVFKDIMTKRAF